MSSTDPDSALDHDKVLAAAFRAAFPPALEQRRIESASAERVFQLYFQEWQWLKAENVGLRQERDEYLFKVDELKAENEALRAQIASLKNQ